MRISLLFLCTLYILHSTLGYAKTLTNENIKEFLRENPSVILDILREHSVELLSIVVEGSEKEAKQELEQQINAIKKSLDEERIQQPHSIITANRPFLGSANAPVTIVAYSDFLCPYCANSAETIATLFSKESNIRYIFKAYTKNPLGLSAYAFFLALWSKDKEKAFTFYNTLFTHQELLIKDKMEYIVQVVKELGYNPNQIQALAKSSAIQAMVNEDSKEGENLKIKGTPTLLINGKYTIIGAVPLEILQYAIEYAQKDS